MDKQTKDLRWKLLAIFVLMIAITMTTTMSNVSASLGSYKQAECIPIITALNSSYVNITTITSPTPNPEILYSNVVMTKQGNAFNYTFCDTTKLGTYTYGYCDDIGNCYSNDFEITSTGNNKSLYIPLIFGITAILFLMTGIFQRNAYLGLFSSFFFVILGIYAMIYGFGVINGTYTQMFSYVVIGIGLMVGFASVGEMYYEGKEND